MSSASALALRSFFEKHSLVDTFEIEDIPSKTTVNVRLRPESREGLEKLTADAVSLWEDHYDSSYEDAAEERNPMGGWDSSITAEPIPPADMEEFLSNIVKEVLALGPSSVLEIGTGTGNILRRLAPHVTSFVGTDFSAESITFIENFVKGRENVRLIQRAADEFEENELGKYDTVVFNSVLQYFPSPEYLTLVLQTALKVCHLSFLKSLILASTGVEIRCLL